MKKCLSLLLAVLLLLSLAACEKAPAETTQPTETTAVPTETTAAPAETTAAPTETAAPEETAEPTEATEPMTPEEQILWERRQTVLDYMRKQTTVLWRSDVSFDYEITTKRDANFSIVAGRLYQGIPYSFGCSAMGSFLEYASEQDENGIYTLTGLNAEAFHGGTADARLGNDCSSAFALAWSQIGASITKSGTMHLCEDYGYLPVGDYENDPVSNANTAGVCATNGMAVMYASYAQLQPADGIVKCKETGGSHAMIIEAVHVEYLEDGTIDGWTSYVSVLDQTSTNYKAQGLEWSEEYGEEICVISGKPRNVTFRTLLSNGYLPITCRELIDPSPLPEPEITDTETVFNKDTLLSGTISCNWWIDAITVRITDSTGAELQKAAVTAIRYQNRTVEMQQFITDSPNRLYGSIDPAALASGNYHCTVVCRLTTGEEFTVRDFDFVV